MSIRPVDPGGIVPVIRQRTGRVIHDSIADALVEYGPNGWHIIRTAIVTDIAAPPEMVLADAVLAPGIPGYGAGHPGIPDLPVMSVSARLCEGCTTKAQVRIEYGYPQAGTEFINPPSETAEPMIEVSSTVQRLMTQYDIDGNQIIVSHIVLSEGPEPGHVIKQPGEVEGVFAMTVFRYRRREPYSPGDKSKAFTGSINSKPVFGDKIGSWLCARIDGSSDDAGASYNVTYEFQRHPQTDWDNFPDLEGLVPWNATVIATDPATGRPTEDPLLNVGIKSIKVARQMDFSRLNLTV